MNSMALQTCCKPSTPTPPASGCITMTRHFGSSMNVLIDFWFWA